MKKKILLATSALALTAGSIFALTGAEQSNAKVSTEQCSPGCCNGSGGDCGPTDCQRAAGDCCEK